MAIYICRWPNGEFSIVSAKTKSDAIELLDEWGNAEQALLARMLDCMLDFRVDDDGQIELASIGEATHDCIMQACYPELDKAFATAEFDETGLGYSAKGQEQIRKAVALERARLMDRPPRGKEAETALGREIQKQTGAASVVIDLIVRAAARKPCNPRKARERSRIDEIDASAARRLTAPRRGRPARECVIGQTEPPASSPAHTLRTPGTS